MKRISALPQRWQHVVLVALLALLGACQYAGENPVSQPIASAAPVIASDEILASENDKRQFRYLELPNQLRVLLISSPGTDKAAAALDVNVGSRQDPPQRQGLAHFLEHMLFLGTDKYPEADAYQDFIAAHGGSHNAFTAFEHTNYFFDIDSAHLEPALDRFSRFFVAPLFSADYVEREKHAVDSEYKANLQNDQRRALDVMREVINPEHPLAKFSVGNLDTLADRNTDTDRPGNSVRDDLLAFYRENYSANLMTLVVIGREPLDQLQAMVADRFAAVPNHRRTLAPIATPLLRPGTAPQFVKIEPVQQQSVLSLAWPLPDQRGDYRGKSLDYIGNILGHEGAGSLLSTLKQRGWALALSAGQGFEYDGGAQFNVSIELTPAGEKRADEIIALVYQTLTLIREDGIADWLYREQQNVAAQRFRFRETPDPSNEASHLAGNLHNYPAAEAIRGDYLMEQFEPQRIAELLAQLTPPNMLAILASPNALSRPNAQFSPSAQTSPGAQPDHQSSKADFRSKTDHAPQTRQTSAFYSVPYQVQSVSPQRAQAWLKPVANAGIRLPAPNIFIADQLPLKPLTAHAGTKPALLAANDGSAIRDGLNVWFLQDAEYRVPKAMVAIEVQTPLANDTARHAATAELLVRMLRENLNEFSYPASLAGLNYDIGRSGRGITLRIEGFDAKQNVLLERMLDALRRAAIDPAALDPNVLARVHEDYRRELRDNSKRPPYELLRSDIGDVLVRNFWTDAELLQHSEKIGAADVRKFAQQLLARLRIDMLVYGNVVAADAQQLGALVARQLLASAQPIAAPAVEIAQLGARDLHRTLPSPHADSALLWYRQAGDNSKTTRAALGVSAQMIGSDFYTRLRTEQQFGYIVAAFPMPLRDVPGLVFLAQSTKAGPAQLAAAYREFLQRWSQRDAQELAPLFEIHRAALTQRLAEAPKNFGEAGERLWQDLTAGYRGFDSREQLIAAAQALTFEQWLALFRRDVLAPEGHSLWLAVDGKFTDGALEHGIDIADLARFKAAQNFYRFD